MMNADFVCLNGSLGCECQNFTLVMTFSMYLSTQQLINSLSLNRARSFNVNTDGGVSVG